MNIEQELDAWRSECMEVMFAKVKGTNMSAFLEAKESYVAAINMHTVAYLETRYDLNQLFYNRLMHVK